MICPKCGEDNSDNFRFCGMCGTVLEARLENRPEARRPVTALSGIASGLSAGPSKTPSGTDTLRPAITNSPAKPANQPIAHIGGPSALGLNPPDFSQSSPSQPIPNQPSMDALRDRAFSGLDSFFEPEQPKTGARRIFLLLALLAALAGAGWWTYTNYLGAAEPRKQATNTSTDDKTAADDPSPKPVPRNAAPESPAGPSLAAAQAPAAVPDVAAENQVSPADATPKTAGAEPKPAVETKPPTPTPTPAGAAAVAPLEKRAAKREPIPTSAKAPALPSPTTHDTGDAAFRKGEAYLYGRGVPENCDEAVKSLKAASAKSNAKARGAFGTMYATGHCVPRDLPTSYLWFAMALRVDPNNQILEKDLNAIWNQMTPPERQAATRMKE